MNLDGPLDQLVFLTPDSVPLEPGFTLNPTANSPGELTCLLPAAMVHELEQEREAQLAQLTQQLKDRGGNRQPAEWQTSPQGAYRVQLQWHSSRGPHLLDQYGQPIDAETAQSAASDQGRARLAMQLKPFLLPDPLVFGSRLRLIGIQVLIENRSLSEPCFEQVAELFCRPNGRNSPGEQLLKAQFVASFL